MVFGIGLMTIALFLFFRSPPVSVATTEPAQPAAAAEVDADYFPLKEKLSWTYTAAYQLPLGANGTTTATTQITGTEKINDRVYFKMLNKVAIRSQVEVLYYRKSDEGIYRVLGGDEAAGESLFLPAKPKVGDTWEGKLGKAKLTYKAVATESIRSADGKEYANCLKITITGRAGGLAGNINDEQWFAPGVGVVRKIIRRSFLQTDAMLKEFDKGLE
jgi:hypothetical protein